MNLCLELKRILDCLPCNDLQNTVQWCQHISVGLFSRCDGLRSLWNAHCHLWYIRQHSNDYWLRLWAWNNDHHMHGYRCSREHKFVQLQCGQFRDHRAAHHLSESLLWHSYQWHDAHSYTHCIHSYPVCQRSEWCCFAVLHPFCCGDGRIPILSWCDHCHVHSSQQCPSFVLVQFHRHSL